MIIVGAGMAGLIAANYFRQMNPVVIDKQRKLPHNHAALLRFRTEDVGKSVGVPFRKVLVRKALVHGDKFVDKSNPYVCNQYSLKVTGKILGRSVWDLESSYRYIAPVDFIHRMSLFTQMNFDIDYEPTTGLEPVISTIPMPIMMEKIGWQTELKFEKRPIWSIVLDIITPEVDVYQTIYFSDPAVPYYRASLVGNRLIIECISHPSSRSTEIISQVLDYFGITAYSYEDATVKEQEYGKIVPIDNDERKEFIYTLTRDYNIYSLGRFATWRQILLDDLIGDLDVINSLMNSEGKRILYNQRIKSAQPDG